MTPDLSDDYGGSGRRKKGEDNKIDGMASTKNKLKRGTQETGACASSGGCCNRQPVP